MTSLTEVCEELKGLDGCLGAAVWLNEECLAASLPSDYDAKRVRALGTGLSRLEHLSNRGGYTRAASVFHWDALSLYSWPVGESATLIMLASPSAERVVLEFSAALAIYDLAPLVHGVPAKSVAAPAPARPMPPPPPKRAQATAQVPVQVQRTAAHETLPESPTPAELDLIEQRLQLLEELIVSELGLAGQALVQRVKRRVGAPQVPTNAWFERLRSAVLAELNDPLTRAVVAASALWLPP